MSIPSPTAPPPTPTPSNPRLIDDFADPQRYSSEQNAMGYYTGDDGTVANKSTVQGDWLLLSVNPTTYWYTNLGPDNTCNDYSAYTKLSLAHSFNVTALIKTATPVGPDSWLHLDLPLTNFDTLDKTRLKAVSLTGFTQNGQVEVDYIYFS
ncbi:hypothetical protein BGZ81_004422 [Podila clonocystis]|nr:hypothetical protein BGZ81_004422 [Podila clonocystis]